MRPIALVPLLCLLAAGCERRVPPVATSPAPLTVPAPPADPARLPNLEGWRALGAPRLSFAGPHRGQLQVTHLNPIAAAALDRNAFRPWPDGSQMLKESFNRKGVKVAVSAMSKEGGEWVWITGDVRGEVTGRFRGEASGACAACHYGRAGRFDGSFAPVTAGQGFQDESHRLSAKNP